MSIELWKAIFDWATVVLIAFTVASGAGALITGNIISERQEAKLRQFDTDITDAKIALGKQQERAATADAKVAGLEKDAANAKAAQQKVETELAKQQERAAIAEAALLDLKRQTAPRRVNAEQRQKFLAEFKMPAGPKHLIKVTAQFAVPDASDFASDLASLLQDAGFSVELDNPHTAVMVAGAPRNIRLAAGHNRFNDRDALAVALIAAGIVKPPIERVDAEDVPDHLSLIVGARVQQHSD